MTTTTQIDHASQQLAAPAEDRKAKRYYKVVAYRDDFRWTVGKLIETIEDAEKLQARFYERYPGTDFYIE